MLTTHLSSSAVSTKLVIGYRTQDAVCTCANPCALQDLLVALQASSEEGGQSTRTSGAGAEAAPATLGHIGLLDLIKDRLVAPGSGVLQVQIKEESMVGTLLLDGTIQADGCVYTSVTQFANAVAAAAGTQCKNGWTATTYLGKCGALIPLL